MLLRLPQIEFQGSPENNAAVVDGIVWNAVNPADSLAQRVVEKKLRNASASKGGERFANACKRSWNRLEAQTSAYHAKPNQQATPYPAC